jgi:dTDP-4-dehydrorhamnose 3,5-epimerase
MTNIIQISKKIDDRGWLAELVRSKDHGQINHVYVTTCLPQVIKAWHFHKNQTDRFILIQGRLMVGLYDESENKYEKKVLMPFSSVLVIPPNIWHGFTAIGNEEAIVLNCTNTDYDPNDEYRKPFDAFEFDWKSKNY